MKLEKVITLANWHVRLQFKAMERSLRATGCDLPLWVIPYDDSRFDLPNNSHWWEDQSLINWLQESKTHPTMRKYQCLLQENYQFIDADACFLRNPVEVLADQSGFITSCWEWHNPAKKWTVTDESKKLMSMKTTTWQKSVFNSGQFACDRRLFDLPGLINAASDPEHISTCLRFPLNEQPGLNLLVFASGVPVTNLTLPPHCMESTWAGDYLGETERYWGDPARKPYLIHWAGGCLWDNPKYPPPASVRPITQIFYRFLTHDERREWDELNARSLIRLSGNGKPSFFRRGKRAASMVIRAVLAVPGVISGKIPLT
jgi:hypothetical protein